MTARRALIAMSLICLAACAGPADRPNAAGESRAAAQPSGSILIRVVRRKWHIDVGFRVADLEPPLAQVARRFPGAAYLFFGFGDRHYLLAGKPGASNMLGALWPGPALILVTAIENTPRQAFGDSQVLELRMTGAQAHAAQTYIWGSIGGRDTPPGMPLQDIEPYAAGPYEGSRYFTAVARYSAAHTCNTWAAEVLRAGGLPVRSRFVVFAGQLWSQARRLAEPRAVGTRSSLTGRTSSRDPPGRPCPGALPCSALNRRAAGCRSDKRPSWCRPGARPPWSSGAAADSSC
jgi:hypothetical protein